MAHRLARTVWKNRATQSAWRAASWTLLGLMLFMALAGCVNLPGAATAASAPAVKNNSLRGTAKLFERTVLPANSIFEATLEETGSFGAPANVISTDSRPAAGVSAVNFSIQFSDSQIRPGRRYAVRGRVLVNGQLLFATEQPMAVLASPQDRTVTITLIRPTLPPAPTAARTPSRAPGNTADTAPAPPAARAAEQKSDPQASRKELQARAQELGAWAAEGRALQTDRSGARLPIAQEGANVVLEQAYLRLFSAGGSNPGVLATVAGRVLPRLAPEGRPQRNTLVVDGFISLGGDACPPEVTAVAMSGRPNTNARPALENMRWKLEQLNQQPVEAIEKQREPHIILQSASRRVTGSGSCNQLLLGYALERTTLRFTEGAITARTCETGMRQERAFLAALATVTSFNMEARTLRLLDAQGRVIARFRAEEI